MERTGKENLKILEQIKNKGTYTEVHIVMQTIEDENEIKTNLADKTYSNIDLSNTNALTVALTIQALEEIIKELKKKPNIAEVLDLLVKITSHKMTFNELKQTKEDN